MSHKNITWSCALLVALALSAPVEANLITNGDFAGGMTGWTTAGTASIGSGYATLGAGGDNRGAIYQSIATTAGDWYSVTYSKSNAGGNINSGVMITAFDGTGNANANAYWGESYWGTANGEITRYFQAAGSTTTLQFRDFNYAGASHDPRLDNVVVEAVTDPTAVFATNVAGQATLTQSSYYAIGTYPASYGTDGVANDFMHTNAGGTQWFDMTFAEAIVVDRLVVTPREGFLQRTGDTVYFYDESDALIGSSTLGNGSFIYINDTLRQPVKRIRVEEGPSNPLNFAEIEVYAVRAMQTEGELTLLRQTFSSNTEMNASIVNTQWVENDGSPNVFETYGPGGASARNMSSTYDHDNNAGTAQVSILGGLEVNHEGSARTLTATLDLPDLKLDGGTIDFWAGLRGNPAGDQTFDIYNVTDDRYIVLGQVISVITTGTTRDWLYNNFVVPFTFLDSGDVIEVRFHATGVGDQGLQLTDLTLTANAVIPEPASLGLLAIGGIGLIARRRTRTRRGG